MRQYQIADKPYRFVEIPLLKDNDRENPKWHDRYDKDTLSGILQCEIKALTPIHVGSGLLELGNEKGVPLIKTHTKSNGKAIIPGSSLKGCIRSIVEAITPSCVSITRAYNSQLPSGTSACKKGDDLCIACRMFGAMGYLGNVRFSDAILKDGWNLTKASIPQLYSTRDRQKTYLKGDGKVRGRKFYKHGTPASGNVPIEVCPKDSFLDFSVSFDNLTESELGLLLIAMGHGEPKIFPKLGGAKPVCYGSIEVFVIESKSRIINNMENAYLQYESAPISFDLTKYSEKGNDILRKGKLEELVKILSRDNIKECPTGNY